MKRRALTLAAVLCLLLTACGGTGRDVIRETNTGKAAAAVKVRGAEGYVPDALELDFTPTLQEEAITRREPEAGTDIQVTYLTLSGHPDPAVQEVVNERLWELVAWCAGEDLWGEPVEIQGGCGYTLIHGRFLSAWAYTYYYHHQAAHPSQGLAAVTLDLENGQVLELTDLISEEEELLERLREGGAVTAGPDPDGGGLQLGEEEIAFKGWEAIFQDIQENGHFFLTEGRINLKVWVPYMMGDLWVLSLPYEEVGDLLAPWFAQAVGVV